MLFIQFYNKSVVTKWHPVQKLIAACGSDSILRLDGRLSLASCITKGYERAKILEKVASFDGFAIHKASSLREDGQAITKIFSLSGDL